MSFFPGTMGHESEPAKPERQMGSLYSFSKDHVLKKHVDKIDISNGLAWSLDNQTMFYIDSLPRKVFAFDFDVTDGNICMSILSYFVFDFVLDVYKRMINIFLFDL